MEEKLLPIGSVVKLKNGQKRLMITGFLQMEQDEKGQKNIWDYSGCLYPEGMLTSEANYVFNHSQIEEVHFIGLVDEEEEEFKKKLKEAIEELENKYPDKNILVVCHGGIVRVIHSYFHDMTNEELMTWLPENCCIQSYEK